VIEGGAASSGEALVLALNSGSSSIKFALFDSGAGGAPALARGTLSDGAKPGFEVRDASGAVTVRQSLAEGAPASAVFAGLLDWIDAVGGGRRLAAVGHRIVHGGESFCEPIQLTPETICVLSALTPLAPLHQPRCLQPVRRIAELRPDLVQIGCFDTAFHRSIDATTRRYGLPRRFEQQGIRKFGFHGLSYEHIADACTAWDGTEGRRRSWRIWAAAPASARCRTASAATPPWASASSTACRWRRAAAPSIPASSSTCSGRWG
jgi:acetate kinase